MYTHARTRTRATWMHASMVNSLACVVVGEQGVPAVEEFVEVEGLPIASRPPPISIYHMSSLSSAPFVDT